MSSLNNLGSTKTKGSAILLPEDRRSRQAAWLLIASLAIFFFASIILYVLYVGSRGVEEEFKQSFYLPTSFIASTAMLVGVSVALQMAGKAAEQDRNESLIFLIIVSIALALLFFIVQTQGMVWLIQETKGPSQKRNGVYAYTVLLALVHALHVLGGFIAMIVVLVRAILNKYDHERNYGVKFCALYWHFLDVVWVVLLIGFGITSYLVNSR